MLQYQLSIDLDYQVFQHSHFLFHILAAKNERQQVIQEDLQLWPQVPFVESVDLPSATRQLRLTAPPGELRVHYAATISIDPIVAVPAGLAEITAENLPDSVLPYLRSSRYCQSDRLQNSSFWEFAHRQPGYARVEAICRWVRERTRFLVGSSHVSTSAIDTLIDQCGVCRDFAHLMIAYCRALSIPARFFTSLDYGADPSLGPPDFHSLVEVFLGGRWYTFDPSGICPTTALPRIATGSDAADVAFGSIFGQVKGSMPKVSIVLVNGTLPSNGSAISTADDEPDNIPAYGGLNWGSGVRTPALATL